MLSTIQKKKNPTAVSPKFVEKLSDHTQSDQLISTHKTDAWIKLSSHSTLHSIMKLTENIWKQLYLTTWPTWPESVAIYQLKLWQISNISAHVSLQIGAHSNTTPTFNALGLFVHGFYLGIAIFHVSEPTVGIDFKVFIHIWQPSEHSKTNLKVKCL